MDALRRDDAQSFGVATDGSQAPFLNAEPQLGRKPNGAEHAQWVVAVCHVGIQGGANPFPVQVVDPAERVHQLAKRVGVQADGHGVDGEVPTVLVVFQRAIFDDGFSAASRVAFFPRPHEFHLVVARLEHGRAEVLEDVDLANAHGLGGGTCQFDAAAFGHDVDVLAGPVQQKVADKSANHERTLSALVGEFSNPLEDGVGEV